ncbi:MAG TPA: dTDP-4-dehydrorhamnose 3,5-epimerase [bacterium]
MPFNFRRLDIEDIILVTPDVFGDTRGFFSEKYKYSCFANAGIKDLFVQDNHSRSAMGILRGLHYQKKPAAQGKLVWCLKGRIFDVAVDIRKKSPSFGKWVGIDLSDENNYMLYIPAGFAHGFVALSDFAEVIYKCTSEYSKEHERGIVWNDPDLSIKWPVVSPVLSERDLQLPLLRHADIDF